MAFEKLFEPARIKHLTLKNRWIMAPMAVLAADREGYPTRQMTDYYCARARGGVGLIIVGAHWILKKYAFPYRACIGDDSYIPRQKEFVAAIHACGSKVALQLHHLGVNASLFFGIMEDPKNYDVVGASAVPFVPSGVVPRELSVADIEAFVEAYGEAARRAQAAGYDAVEIHGAHGYLISQFLSPISNRRTDAYGGTVEKRARFVCEVIARVRAKVGPDYPILMKVNGEDGVPYGKPLEETLRQAPMFVDAGVDALDVSAGISGVASPIPNLDPPEHRIRLAAAVKQVVSVPVIAVGRLADPHLAEQVIARGEADFIAIGRQLLADPEFPDKVRQGRMDQVVRCLCCNNCTERYRSEKDARGVRCTVNPYLLREGDFMVLPVEKPKRVMVIGGGVAGMEAAKMLARRGHHTTLFERSGQLGGQWNIAAHQSFKEQYASLVARLARELTDAGATVRLNQAVTPGMVSDIKPDAVVFATGATPIALKVPGIDGANVVHAYDVLEGRAAVGHRVVVIGGRLVGMEVSLSLARQGKRVSIVTLKKLGENGKPMNANIYLRLRDCLLDADVRFFPHSSVSEIKADGLSVIQGKEIFFLKADTVVVAVGSRPNDAMADTIRALVPEFHMIGDCAEVRKIIDAANEGAEVGRLI